ncbi:unnamed protein product [Pleuronectes platessa]|uniref:Uncharacterized protein n=1 Tax=Pleuronectes platessa TaxID=8262 RepID=A0A9N7UAG0_PLEPL|nr:unnamed protein product [Pleuronectes platessa]
MAFASATTHPGPPSPTQQLEESALFKLLKGEMVTSRQLLGDTIKQEMVIFRAEMKQDLEALRQNTKAEIASLKMEFRVEMASLRSAPTEKVALNSHDSSITSMESVMSELKREFEKLKDRNDDLENRGRI